MKTNITLLLAATLALSACGSASRIASSGQQYKDGIYYRPEPIPQEVLHASAQEVNSLVRETKGSEIYLRSGQNDTLFIPDDMSAAFKFDKKAGTTTVTVFQDAPKVDLWLGYPPYSSWSYPSWRYNSWAYSPWYRNWGWDPWYANPYWDPIYYRHWAWDPWYPGGFGYPWGWDPWYGFNAHWDPYWGMHLGWHVNWGWPGGWHGHWGGHWHDGWHNHGRDIEWTPRNTTNLSSRGDAIGGTTSAVRRTSTASRGNVSRASGTATSVRRAAVTPVSRDGSSSTVRNTSGTAVRRSASATRNTASAERNTVSTYRRPANSTVNYSTGTTSGNGNRSATTATRSATTRSSSSSYENNRSSSSSSYSRSSSGSYSGGSRSSGGSYSGGGGGSRRR